MKIKENVTFHKWKKCIELRNGNFRIIVTTQIGPRIVGAFLENSDNLFYVFPEYEGTSGQEQWTNYGGHRLWHSPEDAVRSYQPDSFPVHVEKKDDGSILFTAETEGATGIQKSIFISPEGENSFRIEHGIRNNGLWNVEVAAWALSVMAPGGTAVLPHNSEDTSLLPNKSVVFWPYSKMSDPRFIYGEHLLLLKQTSDGKPTKVGMNSKDGWCAYINHGIIFAKCFDYYDEEEYPDFGCSCEAYSCERFLELETLSPLVLLERGDAIIHSEIWTAAKANTDNVILTEADAVQALGLDYDEDEDNDDDECCCVHEQHEHHNGHCDCSCHEEPALNVHAESNKTTKRKSKSSPKK